MKPAEVRSFITASVLGMAVFLLLAACEPGPRELNFGNDECAHCRMIITEREFASQLVNSQGRVHPFDSIECMAAFEYEMEDSGNIHSRWAPDFAGGGEKWLRADQAWFLRSETLRSPMGLHLSAYDSRKEADVFAAEYGGEILQWNGVLPLVAGEWDLGGAP